MFPTPQAKMMFPASALMLFALFCGAGAALAQNSVRGAASPVPLSVSGTAGEPARPAAGAPDPVGKAEPQSKFPNKDTAKNRQDYEMGTDTGTIQLGRDDATGDTVMGHTPPKKVQEPYPLEQQPIQVWPVVPVRRR